MKSKLSLRRARSIDDTRVVAELDRRFFSTDTPMRRRPGDACWILWEGDTPVGFCSVRGSKFESDVALFGRSALSKEHRGGGLQRRLIRVRLKWAREQAKSCALATVMTWNGASLYNFFKCGFKTYEPRNPWMSKDTVYLKYEIQP